MVPIENVRVVIRAWYVGGLENVVILCCAVAARQRDTELYVRLIKLSFEMNISYARS